MLTAFLLFGLMMTIEMYNYFIQNNGKHLK